MSYKDDVEGAFLFGVVVVAVCIGLILITIKTTYDIAFKDGMVAMYHNTYELIINNDDYEIKRVLK